MTALTIVLDRRKIIARMEAKSIRVEHPNLKLKRIPLQLIDQMIVIGNPMVSCDVWRALAKNNIPAVLLSSRGKFCAAHIGLSPSGKIENRIAQYKSILNNDKSQSDISRWLLVQKLKGQLNLLKKFEPKKKILQRYYNQIEKNCVQLKYVTCRDRLMGYEGAAAAAYFKGLSKILPALWNFKGRNKRPPRDPVNAILSFSYTIAMGPINKIIVEKHLDASLGFLHAPISYRNNLILDILEPLRPEIDEFAIQLMNTKMNQNCFTTNKQDGCRLNKKGRSLFFPAWIRWKESSENDFKRKIRKIISQLIKKINEV
jgi:CRISP-associated protein Cas1